MLYFIIGYILGFILGIILVADWVRKQILGDFFFDLMQGKIDLRMTDLPKIDQKYVIFKVKNTQKNLSP